VDLLCSECRKGTLSVHQDRRCVFVACSACDYCEAVDVLPRVRVGALVRIAPHKTDVPASERRRTARVVGEGAGVRGGLELDTKVAGFYCWNRRDLVAVRERRASR